MKYDCPQDNVDHREFSAVLRRLPCCCFDFGGVAGIPVAFARNSKQLRGMCRGISCFIAKSTETDGGAPLWPAASPAQWHRPRMWVCVGPRNPTTKPSRGCLCVVELSAIRSFLHKKFQGKSHSEKNVQSPGLRPPEPRPPRLAKTLNE